MSIREFRELGFLQEVNRCFLHPLGLALEARVPEDGSDEYLAGVWDYRSDPEGITYAPDTIEVEKIEQVDRERDRHSTARRKLLGGWIVQRR